MHRWFCFVAGCDALMFSFWFVFQRLCCIESFVIFQRLRYIDVFFYFSMVVMLGNARDCVI